MDPKTFCDNPRRAFHGHELELIINSKIRNYLVQYYQQGRDYALAVGVFFVEIATKIPDIDTQTYANALVTVLGGFDSKGLVAAENVRQILNCMIEFINSDDGFKLCKALIHANHHVGLRANEQRQFVSILFKALQEIMINKTKTLEYTEDMADLVCANKESFGFAARDLAFHILMDSAQAAPTDSDNETQTDAGIHPAFMHSDQTQIHSDLPTPTQPYTEAEDLFSDALAHGDQARIHSDLPTSTQPHTEAEDLFLMRLLMAIECEFIRIFLHQLQPHTEAEDLFSDALAHGDRARIHPDPFSSTQPHTEAEDCFSDAAAHGDRAQINPDPSSSTQPHTEAENRFPDAAAAGKAMEDSPNNAYGPAYDDPSPRSSGDEDHLESSKTAVKQIA